MLSRLFAREFALAFSFYLFVLGSVYSIGIFTWFSISKTLEKWRL